MHLMILFNAAKSEWGFQNDTFFMLNNLLNVTL